MAINQLTEAIQRFPDSAIPVPEPELSDGQLLDRYLDGREESAFAALVHRHGGMVWGVCQRVLRQRHDVEDAFQATFLVLVKKAASIASKELLANWLYGVAHRTALKARAMAAKRGFREKHVADMPEPSLTPSATPKDLWDDVQAKLDQELSRLPEKYRAVIVVCDLEGKTRKEAARLFRVPEGTVASRLATARTKLADRLSRVSARTGLAISGGTLATLVSQNSASASVPMPVISNTIQAAAGGAASSTAVALANGVLKSMLLNKLKLAASAIFLSVFVLTSVVMIAQRVMAKGVPENEIDTASQFAAGQPAAGLAPAVNQIKAVEPLPDRIVGTAKATDPQAKTITIAIHQGPDATFTVANDAQVQIDGKDGELGAIPTGATIVLRRFTDAKTTANVTAEGRWFWGFVKEIDVPNSTLSYGEKAQDGAAGRTFKVPANVFLTIDNKIAKLADIPIGAKANLQLMSDQLTIRSLALEGGQINGVVKAVDRGARTITVNDTVCPIASNTDIIIDHKRGNLDDLPAGCQACVDLQVDQKTALRIHATGASLFGTVKGVDLRNNSITIGQVPSDRVIHVPADTKIFIDNKPGTLAGIPAGSQVHALNLRVDQQTASSINVMGPGVHNAEIKAVDLDKRTLSFGDNAPSPIAGKTIVVPPEATIQIDGAPGTFAKIPAGAFAGLGLSVDLQSALQLTVEGQSLGDCGGSCISAIDADRGAVTFSDKAAANVANRTFTIAKDAEIRVDDRSGKLTELPTGCFVNVTLAVDGQSVRRLAARGPTVAGTVRSVDAGLITVDETRYTVAKEAIVVIDGRVRPIGELQVGAEVRINVRIDGTTVGMIQTIAK